jgi:hypothetical protein
LSLPGELILTVSYARIGAMIGPTMATHTATADDTSRGWILIKDGPVLIASIWGFDIASVGTGAKNGETQITIRRGEGLWIKTTASVADVHRAVSAARTLYYSSRDIRDARRSA